jgi:hypothetical protein
MGSPATSFLSSSATKEEGSSGFVHRTNRGAYSKANNSSNHANHKHRKAVFVSLSFDAASNLKCTFQITVAIRVPFIVYASYNNSLTMALEAASSADDCPFKRAISNGPTDET